MSLDLYDRALIAKINSWTNRTDIHLYGPDETQNLIEVMADESGDKALQLPIISISRNIGYEILNPNKKVLTYDGMLMDATDTKSINLNAVPINILYQIDVWTRYQKEADEYMRNLIFNLINYPTLKVIIPYNQANLEHNATLRIATDVLDNSNSNKLATRQFTRISIGISIDDAYLWDTRVRNVIRLSGDTDTYEILDDN